MEQILLYVKQNLKILWRIIEGINGFIFWVLYKRKLDRILNEVFMRVEKSNYIFRRINSLDIMALHNMLTLQSENDLEYFKPHAFDIRTLKKYQKSHTFLMMGTYDKDKLIGYFFLRFFANKRCFVGRLIDDQYRGQGIGSMMNLIMYETAWGMDFRCFSTISRNNKNVIKAHAKNPNMVVLKELDNNYLLIEFVRNANSAVKVDEIVGYKK